MTDTCEEIDLGEVEAVASSNDAVEFNPLKSLGHVASTVNVNDDKARPKKQDNAEELQA